MKISSVFDQRSPRTIRLRLLALGLSAGLGLQAQHEHGPPSAASPTPRAVGQQNHANHDTSEIGTTAPVTMFDFGGIAATREASGTAWQPDATPMHAHHTMAGAWSLMTHYNAFLAYDEQSGRRGDSQLNSINWLMFMASRGAGEGELMLRTMLSLEPWTTTGRGYPLLFQSGEAYHGEPLVDRQHPHDFFMELAARYRREVTDRTVASLYVAPAGEPALGPPAFPHRLSAMDNPAAPISHHWLDSTHISFGVLTAGIARPRWQLEGSWFNGREPDEDRWGIDLTRLDSYAGRFTWNPSAVWSAQVSAGYLESPEELHPNDDLWRATASVMHLTKLSDEDRVATTVGWGRNDTHEQPTDAVLIESAYLRRSFSVFARAEYVEKTGEELHLDPHDRLLRIKQVSVGATRELVRGRPWQLALGGAVSYTFEPSELTSVYGEHPIGAWVFLRLRPAVMDH